MAMFTETDTELMKERRQWVGEEEVEVGGVVEREEEEEAVVEGAVDVLHMQIQMQVGDHRQLRENKILTGMNLSLGTITTTNTNLVRQWMKT
jgi:hypothetical protein